MARQKRQFYPGEFYHVMLRGNNGKEIFRTIDDRQYFLSLLSDGLKKFDHRIPAYCLMSNHVHLAVQAGNDSLEKPMHNLATRYAKLFNWQNNLVGHLFQGRYLALHVRNEPYLKQLVRYIHLNPVRANMVGDPQKYLWSSHQAYLGLKDPEFIDIEFILSLFGENEVSALKEYRHFINTEENMNDPHLYEIIFTKPENQLDYLIEFCCKYYHVAKQALLQKYPNHEVNRVKCIISWLAIETKVCTLAEVSKHLQTSHSRLHRSIETLKAEQIESLQAAKAAYFK